MSNRQKSLAPNLADAFTMQGGYLVSNEHTKIVEAIREYSPELDVAWIPPGARKPGDSAWAIIHNPPGAESYVMWYEHRDEDLNEKTLQRIIMSDQRHRSFSISEYEAWEEAQKRLAIQDFNDSMEEAHEMAKAILRSPLNDYKFSKSLRIKEGIPFNVANGEDYQ